MGMKIELIIHVEHLNHCLAQLLLLDFFYCFSAHLGVVLNNRIESLPLGNLQTSGGRKRDRLQYNLRCLVEQKNLGVVDKEFSLMVFLVGGTLC